MSVWKVDKMFKQNLLKHYGFDSEDALRLKALAPIMEKHKEKMSQAFCDYLLQFEDTARLLSEQGSIDLRKKTIEIWFMELFDGKYDQAYLNNVKKIGYAHKRVDLDIHNVNAAMTFIRHFIHEILDKEIEDPIKRRAARSSIRKILDINLGIIISSYREAEFKHVFVSKKMERLLINFCERFSYGMNLVVVIGLVVLSLAIIALFVRDISHIFAGNVEHGVIIALGTMLIIWVMIELMSAEIQHIKEGKFSLKIFIEVALVAFIRDALVASLHHEEINKMVTIAGIVFLLSIVYWIIYRTEKTL
jgi:uncharacterized membrane protein (DUF373 family)